jgi:hypothetical protein
MIRARESFQFQKPYQFVVRDNSESLSVVALCIRPTEQPHDKPDALSLAAMIC